jgi:hypothetical protein
MGYEHHIIALNMINNQRLTFQGECYIKVHQRATMTRKVATGVEVENRKGR